MFIPHHTTPIYGDNTPIKMVQLGIVKFIVLPTWLVWNMFYDFPYIRNVIIPTDELHHFSEGFNPPTRKAWMIILTFMSD